MSWTCPKNVSIKIYFVDTLLRRGHGLDMKIEDKRPREGNGAWRNTGSRQGARRSICLSEYEYSHPTQSKNDIVITRQLKSNGGNLRIRLLDHIIFEFTSQTEDYDWEEGGGWLSSLISLRVDILHGDYRSLYLAWLLCAQMEEMEDDELEPPVPPNLADLNAPLNSFVDFMRLDTDLIAVAAESSEVTNDLRKAPPKIEFSESTEKGGG